jgi:hypothetical protein
VDQMRKRTLLQRIAGAVAGLVAGGVPLGCLLGHIMSRGYSDTGDIMGAWLLFGGLGFLTGATLGAAAGATLAQRLMKRRSHFWRAWLGALALLLLGALVSLPIAMDAVAGYYDKPASHGLFHLLIVRTFMGAILFSPATVVTGAVLGAGWKAGPAPTPAKPGAEQPQG